MSASMAEGIMPRIADPMAAVMLDHRFSRTGHCMCGAILFDMDPIRIANHVAEQLAANGYGKLEDAFEQGRKSGMRHADRVTAALKIGRPELAGSPSPNPYRTKEN